MEAPAGHPLLRRSCRESAPQQVRAAPRALSPISLRLEQPGPRCPFLGHAHATVLRSQPPGQDCPCGGMGTDLPGEAGTEAAVPGTGPLHACTCALSQPALQPALLLASPIRPGAPCHPPAAGSSPGTCSAAGHSPWPSPRPEQEALGKAHTRPHQPQLCCSSWLPARALAALPQQLPCVPPPPYPSQGRGTRAGQAPGAPQAGKLPGLQTGGGNNCAGHVRPSLQPAPAAGGITRC